jgi:hypothetical protein
MNDLPPPLPAQFKNRTTGLRVFGVLTVLGGLLCALFLLLILKTSTMAQHAGTMPHQPVSLLLPTLIYGGLAVALIWLGVGSIMTRRWARALLLIISWASLIIGVISLVFMAAMTPQIIAAMQSAQPAGQAALPDAAKYGALIFIGAIFGVILIVIPAIWVFFYGSKHVKATCEARDPVERWTDRCPLPVIAGSLMTAFGTLSMLATALSGHGAIPFFGIILSGLPGTLVYIAWALIMGYGAWAMYRLDPRGWWVIFALMCVWPISSALTFWHHDMAEFYQLMGYSADQMAGIQKIGLFKGQGMVWLTLFSAVPWIGFLLYLRKFFRRSA